ncbi:MAG: ImmA/IrrE family metallo-endopeptidase, partial [Moorellaceae bacterium]
MGQGSVWDVWREPENGRMHARMVARKILAETGMTPPVNPYMLLRNYRRAGIDGVDIEWFSNVKIDGWSGYSGEHRRLAVFINSSQSYVKKRWTGAHELGHAVLKHSLHP